MYFQLNINLWFSKGNTFFKDLCPYLCSQRGKAAVAAGGVYNGLFMSKLHGIFLQLCCCPPLHFDLLRPRSVTTAQ